MSAILIQFHAHFSLILPCSLPSYSPIQPPTSRVSSLITASPLPPHVFVRSHMLSPQTRHFAKRTPVSLPDSRKILLVALLLQVSPSHRQRNSPAKSRKHFLTRPYAAVYESVFNVFVFALDIVHQYNARTSRTHCETA